MQTGSGRLVIALLVAGVLAGCGGGGDGPNVTAPSPTPSATPTDSGTITHRDSNAAVALRIGSKNFTEQEVLGEIYAQGLASAGYKVDTMLDIGDQDALLRAVEKGRIDAYPEYTGTALLAFFGKRSDAIPRSAQAAYEEAKAGFAAEHPPLVAYPPTPFTSSNEVAVTRATARRYKLRKISDLAKVANQLVLWGPPECRRRHDCLLGLEQVYGLHFKRFMPVPIGRRHEVLKSGEADVSIVFTTDPQIKRDSEVLLKDDRGMFPPYNSTLVVRKEVSDRAGPDLGRTVKLLQEQLTAENMQELNARVDLDHKAPAEVAKEYLQETGLVAF